MNIQQFLVGFAYSFHMPLFFILAGAVFCNSIEKKGLEDARSFFVKKTRRLLLPYLTYGLLFMIPIKFLVSWYAPGQSFTGILKNYVLYGSDSGHLWFLVSLFAAYIVAYAVACLVNAKSFGSILLVVFVCWLLCYWGMNWSGFLPHSGETTAIFSNKYLLCLALGMLLHKCRPAFDWLIDKKSFLAVALAALLFYLQIKGFRGGKHAPVLYASLVFVEVYLLAGAALRIKAICERVDRGWFWFVSKNLMGVYLLHDPFDYVVLHCYKSFGLFEKGVSACYVSFFRFVGLFLLSLLLSWLIERTIKWINATFFTDEYKNRFARLLPFAKRETVL